MFYIRFRNLDIRSPNYEGEFNSLFVIVYRLPPNFHDTYFYIVVSLDRQAAATRRVAPVPIPQQHGPTRVSGGRTCAAGGANAPPATHARRQPDQRAARSSSM